MGLARAHIRVKGLVQGVFFRDSTRREAAEHGVSGWVRNCPDGTVEAVLEGPQQAVEEMTRWAAIGPPAATVEEVNIEWEQYSGRYSDFSVL